MDEHSSWMRSSSYLYLYKCMWVEGQKILMFYSPPLQHHLFAHCFIDSREKWEGSYLSQTCHHVFLSHAEIVEITLLLPISSWVDWVNIQSNCFLHLLTPGSLVDHSASTGLLLLSIWGTIIDCQMLTCDKLVSYPGWRFLSTTSYSEVPN